MHNIVCETALSYKSYTKDHELMLNTEVTRSVQVTNNLSGIYPTILYKTNG